MTEASVLQRVVPPPRRTFFANAMVTLTCDVCRVSVTRRQIIRPGALSNECSEPTVGPVEPEWICHACLLWIDDEVKRRNAELAAFELAAAPVATSELAVGAPCADSAAVLDPAGESPAAAAPTAAVTKAVRKAPPVQDRSTCVSSKVFYPDEASATKALAKWRARRRPGQFKNRVYQCLWCPGWHLTHKGLKACAPLHRHYGA